MLLPPQVLLYCLRLEDIAIYAALIAVGLGDPGLCCCAGVLERFTWSLGSREHMGSAQHIKQPCTSQLGPCRRFYLGQDTVP